MNARAHAVKHADRPEEAWKQVQADTSKATCSIMPTCICAEAECPGSTPLGRPGPEDVCGWCWSRARNAPFARPGAAMLCCGAEPTGMGWAAALCADTHGPLECTNGTTPLLFAPLVSRGNAGWGELPPAAPRDKALRQAMQLRRNADAPSEECNRLQGRFTSCEQTGTGSRSKQSCKGCR